MVKCKKYYDYIIEYLDKIQSNNINIFGEMPKECLGYLKFEKIK